MTNIYNKRSYFSSTLAVTIVLLAIATIPHGVYAETIHTTRFYLSVAGQTLIVQNKNGKQDKSILVSDYLSSTKAIINESGSVSTYTAYYPFGIAISDLNLDKNKKYYTGQQKVTDDSDVYNYKARYYNPETGFFIQPDSVEGPNRFAYVNGDPISYHDLDGNQGSPAFRKAVTRAIEEGGLVESAHTELARLEAYLAQLTGTNGRSSVVGSSQEAARGGQLTQRLFREGTEQGKTIREYTPTELNQAQGFDPAHGWNKGEMQTVADADQFGRIRVDPDYWQSDILAHEMTHVDRNHLQFNIRQKQFPQNAWASDINAVIHEVEAYRGAGNAIATFVSANGSSLSSTEREYYRLQYNNSRSKQASYKAQANRLAQQALMGGRSVNELGDAVSLNGQYPGRLRNIGLGHPVTRKESYFFGLLSTTYVDYHVLP